MDLSELSNIFKVSLWYVFEWATYWFLFITMIETTFDEGVGLEDPEDPGYLVDQGKQPFDHVWAYVIFNASKANTLVAYDYKYLDTLKNLQLVRYWYIGQNLIL